MCGIVALWDEALAPAERRATVDRMRDALAHRGPDGAATWAASNGAPPLVLGHRRLAIRGLGAQGPQPRPGASSELTFNAGGTRYSFRVPVEATPQ